MEIIPIEYRHLYIAGLSSSGGPKNDGTFWNCITYYVDNKPRELWRRSDHFIPIGNYVLAHENYLEFHKSFDPEEGTQPDKLIQYDSVYNITNRSDGGGTISVQESTGRLGISNTF